MGNLSFSILLVLGTTMLVFLSGITVAAHPIYGGAGAGAGAGGHHKRGGGHHAGGLCKGSRYLVLCNGILKPGVRGAASATTLAISAAIFHTSQAKSKATSLLEAAGSIYMKSSLEICVQMYDDAIGELVTAIQNVRTRDITTLEQNLSTAMTDYDSCEQGFMELPGGTCPMDNELLSQYISNCLLFAGKIRDPIF